MKRIILFCSVLFLGGCSSQIQLSVDELVQNQEVSLDLKSGEKVQGTISKIQDNSITINDNEGQTWRAKKDQITRVEGPEPVFDQFGQIISEQEIANKQTNKNFWKFTLSGSALSLGTSFFLSSMISRSDDDNRDPIIYTGTTVGTLLGGWMFSKIGHNKDRRVAISEIDTKRAAAAEHDKREKIQSEIDKLQKEREAQEAELESLRKKASEKNNSH